MLINYTIDGSVARITLNRPDKFNSFNREMALELQGALKNAQKDENVRAIYITAEGKAFCAGQDLTEAMDPSGPGIEKIVAEHYNPIVILLRMIEKPIICAVNGVAAGAGANIAFACDITYAGKSASFIQAFSKIGLVPDSGGTYTLPRLIGFQKATALMMLGDKVLAEDAEKMGMIFKAVDDAELQTVAFQTAKTLSEMPTKGLGLTKRLLNKSFSNTFENQLQQEQITQAEAGQTHDYNEGVKAFLEKRKAVFKGK
ncbi:MAG: enoyl-CoA hydratase/isomerase family protein [Bacteroidetes bacterium]|nr:enoyl-CoA hydratase/isomerase family protein [Bacteroidota bacterium]MBL0033431.1 enoyl-CoA hydratase/isomerase family protein [Bacteroidota bacterium]